MKKIISVAVGIVYNAEQQVLLAWRDAHRNQGGCWEFPGGKLEPGENCYDALCRELREEIAIIVQKASPLPPLQHEYENLSVTLFPWKVETFLGAPRGQEGQKILWVAPAELHSMPLPAANYAILDYLCDETIASKKNYV